MDFRLFILLNAVLFIRPVDLFPQLGALPLYEVLILACTVAAQTGISRQLSIRSLSQSPVTLCVFGLFAAVILSNLARLNFYDMLLFGELFAKIVLYYLLAVSTLNSPQRLRTFVRWLVLIVAIVAGLAVLHYHEVIDIPSLAALDQREYHADSDEAVVYTRLRAIGIFNDPNDLAVLLNAEIVLSLFLLIQERALLFRVLGLGALIISGYAFALTQSRGGLLGLMAGLLALFYCRYGWKKSVVLGGVAIPALLLLVGGRQAELSTGTSTARERIELWADGLQLFKQSPLFGIGTGQYQEQLGLQAHNSYLHCFVELGVLGGTMFVGLWYAALYALRQPSETEKSSSAGIIEPLRPFLTAALIAFAVGLFSLSRVFVAPTYLLLALATAYNSVTDLGHPQDSKPGALAMRIGLVSCLVLAGLYLFVRVVLLAS